MANLAAHELRRRRVNLYLLKRRTGVRYDQYASFVVAALDPQTARETAADVESWDDSTHDFLRPRLATIKRIGTYTGRRVRPHIVHSDFRAG